MMVYMASCFIFIPAWVWLAKFIGKKKAYTINILVGAIGMISFMLPNPGDKYSGLLASFAAGFSGISFTNNNFLFTAIQADVVEYDQLR